MIKLILFTYLPKGTFGGAVAPSVFGGSSLAKPAFGAPAHTVAMWTFTFHKKSRFVKLILKANFKPVYRPVS